VGGAFAQFEMEVVLAEIAARTPIGPARDRSERVYRRAITETPRHDAEVILSG
jgi:cytochrome P450